MNGVKKSTGDILIFVDADLIVPAISIHEGVTMLKDYSYVVPFTHIYYLNNKATDSYICNKTIELANDNLERIWMSKSKGGINIVERKKFIESGGFDPRFTRLGF